MMCNKKHRTQRGSTAHKSVNIKQPAEGILHTFMRLEQYKNCFGSCVQHAVGTLAIFNYFIKM